MIPTPLRDQLERELGTIRGVRALAGGSVSQAFRLDLARGPLFLKVQRSAPDAFFEVERAGLALIASSGAPLRIPRVEAVGRIDEQSYIVMEYLEPEHERAHEEWLGAGLAELHRIRGEHWGWDREGFIGPLIQPNAPTPTWSDFWLMRRLEPQLRRLDHPIGTNAEWSELERLLPAILSCGESEGPSLLHGDLWSGNVLSTADGPALVDPAAFYGHREVDLAMADLFGGFRPAFFRSYADRWPLLPGYEARKGVYQLYYLLVHVNLFGGSYISRTHQTLRRVLSLAQQACPLQT